MTTSDLLPPVLITRNDLERSSTLTASVIQLINDAFSRSKATVPSKWNNGNLRFPTKEAFSAMLDKDSVFALIFDSAQDAQFGGGTHPNDTPSDISASAFHTNKVVACAAAVPWKGGWAGEGAGIEEGWEMKTVCVDGDVKFLQKGLASQVLKALEDHLISNMKIQPQKTCAGEDRGQLQLWILAAECLNGAYWRRKGYVEMRRKTEGVGVWSCKTSFDMVVFRRIVTFGNDK